MKDKLHEGLSLELLIEIGVKHGVQIKEVPVIAPIKTLSAKGLVEKRINDVYVLSEKGKEVYNKILDYYQTLL